MYVRDPLRVVVAGPLAAYAAGFCAELERQGYAAQPASELAQLMAHVSRWLDGQGLMPEELTEEVADRFLADRRGKYRKFRTRRGLRPLLTYLRRIGVVPSAEQAVQDTSADVALLVEEYRRFLINERGLAEVSILRYLPAVRGFLAGLPGPVEAELGRLSAAEVSRFVLDQAGLRSVPDAKSMVTALRSLLRFLFVTGRIDRELAAAVPTVANRKLATLPGRLRAGEAGLLLGGCDRDTGPAAATSRSSRCWPGWGCAPARPPACSWVTSTGGRVSSPFTARAGWTTGCRCRPMSARPWWITSCTAARPAPPPRACS